MPTNNSNFLIPKGDYKNLIAFQKSECIYESSIISWSIICPK